MKKINLFTKPNKYPVQDGHVQKGLLFIPDISGFTEFVHSTDVLTGKEITYELLSAVISQNNIGLSIAEIEGDAVLFYRFGDAPSFVDLMEQCQLMTKAFDSKLEELRNRFSNPLNLSLKIIAHYGPMTAFKIGRFKKLYGQVVVETHRLLKNSVACNSYLLLTDSLLEITEILNDDGLAQQGIRSNKLCEVYGALRNICFTYFDFSEEKVMSKVA